MKIGFSLAPSGPLSSPEMMSRLAVAGEELGYDYASISDHVVEPVNIHARYPYSESGEFPRNSRGERHEEITTIAYLAGKTKKLGFLTSVMVVPHRPAVLTAKILSTIDYLSKGRLTLGIGVGWCREEFEAIAAAPFDDRGHVTDEWMMACKELWSNDEPRFDGKYVKFSDVVFTPKPVQQPIPIWVGGESAPALRRTVRYADCWYPVGTNPQFPMNTLSRFKAGLARFRGFAERGGRDPATVKVALRVLNGPSARPRRTIEGEGEMFTGGTVDYLADLKALAELGVDAVDVRLTAATLGATLDNMQRFHDEVLTKVR